MKNEKRKTKNEKTKNEKTKKRKKKKETTEYRDLYLFKVFFQDVLLLSEDDGSL